MTTNEKLKRLTTKQFYEVQRTIENHCCNYCDEQCLLYDDGDYPLCRQHGLRYLVCPYFKSIVLHNNRDLMEDLLEIPKNAKQCHVCHKFFLPRHKRCEYCPDCAEQVAKEKARKRSQKYRDQKKLDRHGL